TDYTAGSELEQVVAMLMKRILAASEVSMAHALQVQRAHRRRGNLDAPLDIPMRRGLEDEEME
ncbi:MAG: hypothetical protein Q4A88_10240, partial [Clostridia bacterium]|nr:hypothetical protein [Clostridia bacterium]